MEKQNAKKLNLRLNADRIYPMNPTEFINIYMECVVRRTRYTRNED